MDEVRTASLLIHGSELPVVCDAPTDETARYTPARADRMTERLAKFCEEEGVELLLLFGSRAKDVAAEGSDWDVGVLMKRGLLEADRYLDFSYRLAQAMGRGNLDVVDLRRAAPLLKYEAARTGRPLYQADPSAFTRFHVYAWKLYQDDRRSLRSMDMRYLDDARSRLLA